MEYHTVYTGRWIALSAYAWSFRIVFSVRRCPLVGMELPFPNPGGALSLEGYKALFYRTTLILTLL